MCILLLQALTIYMNAGTFSGYNPKLPKGGGYLKIDQITKLWTIFSK